SFAGSSGALGRRATRSTRPGMSLVGFDHAHEQVHQGAALARAERCKHAVLLGQQFGAQTRAQLLTVRSDMDLPCAAVLAIYPLVNQTAGHKPLDHLADARPVRTE